MLSSELKYLSEMYEAMRRKLFDCGGASIRHPADPVLAGQELISRIGHLDRRVAQLVANWQAVRNSLDPGRRAQIEASAASVSAQLARLQQICGEHARSLDEAMQRISRELGELERGARYLASVRPVKANFPKFLDSTI